MTCELCHREGDHKWATCGICEYAYCEVQGDVGDARDGEMAGLCAICADHVATPEQKFLNRLNAKITERYGQKEVAA